MAATAWPKRCACTACACLFTLCGGHISPILSAAKARGIRIVDVRDEATAVFAADATARLSGIPGRRRRHGRAGHHQHHHRAEERAAGAVAGDPARRRRAHRAAGPRRAAGHRPAAAGGAARQAVPQDHEGARPGPGRRGGLRRRALRRARAGVRRMPGGPAVRRGVDPPVVCRSGRQGQERGRPAAALLPEPPCAQDVRRQRSCPPRSGCCAVDAAQGDGRRAARGAGRVRQGAAAADGDRQPGRGAGGAGRRAGRGRRPARRAGVPVGHGARPAGARPSAAAAPPAPPGPARGRLRAAGRRALRLPARLRQACAARRHADRRQPQRRATRA